MKQETKRKTEINCYGNLTVEIIEEFINNSIIEAEKQIERFKKYGDEAYKAHLLHESLLHKAILKDFKSLLGHRDLWIECEKKPEDRKDI
jgi:hypothetical protein